MLTEDEFKSMKSKSPKDLFSEMGKDTPLTGDMIGQVMRIHLWAEKLIDGIIFQTEKTPKDRVKQTFAHKQKYLFDSGLIDKTHYQELKILNNIRNQYSHELNSDEQVIEAIKKFPSYHDYEKSPQFIEITIDEIRDGSIFGLISISLVTYLMSVFWNPKIMK